MGFGSVLGTIAGSVFGPGGAAIGGALGGAFDSRKAQKKADAYNAYNSLSGRVAEAKRVGIHPLAALGYNQGEMIVPGQSNQGAPIADAIHRAQKQKLGKPQQQANLEATNASAARDFAEAALLNSRAKREQMAAIAQPDRIPLQSTQLTGPGQGKFITSPSTPQQIVEDEYGGVVGEGYGMYRAIQDYMGPNRPGRKRPTEEQFRKWAEGYTKPRKKKKSDWKKPTGTRKSRRNYP